MNNPSSNDPQFVWKTQETVAITMTAEEIRERMQQLHGRNRGTNAALTAVFSSIGIYYLFQALEVRDVLRTIGCMLISLGNLYWAYLAAAAFRSSRPAELAPDEPLQTSLQFYKRILGQILEQIRSSNRRGLKGAVPLLLGFSVLVIQSSRESIPSVGAEIGLKAIVQSLGVPAWLIAWLPFVLIIASWAALKVYARMTSARWIKHELERVDQIN